MLYTNSTGKNSHMYFKQVFLTSNHFFPHPLKFYFKLVKFCWKHLNRHTQSLVHQEFLSMPSSILCSRSENSSTRGWISLVSWRLCGCFFFASCAAAASDPSPLSTRCVYRALAAKGDKLVRPPKLNCVCFQVAGPGFSLCSFDVLSSSPFNYCV